MLFVPSSAILNHFLLIGAVCGIRTRDDSLEGCSVSPYTNTAHLGVDAHYSPISYTFFIRFRHPDASDLFPLGGRYKTLMEPGTGVEPATC